MNRFLPSAYDCYFFFVYGTCFFGNHCKFNHNTQRNGHQARRSPSNPCRHYVKGYCRYGARCRYFHPVNINQLNPWRHFNSIGLPKRWGESNCTHFMRTGQCGHGLSCHSNHPEPNFYYPYQGYYSTYANGQAIHYPIVVNNGWTSNVCIVVVKEPDVTLNAVGLPLRPGTTVCKMFTNSGHCKYGRGCKFDHPMAPSANQGGPSTTNTTTTVE